MNIAETGADVGQGRKTEKPRAIRKRKSKFAETLAISTSAVRAAVRYRGIDAGSPFVNTRLCSGDNPAPEAEGMNSVDLASMWRETMRLKVFSSFSCVAADKQRTDSWPGTYLVSSCAPSQ